MPTRGNVQEFCRKHPQERRVVGSNGKRYCQACNRESMSRWRATPAGKQSSLEAGRRHDRKRVRAKVQYNYKRSLMLKYSITLEQRDGMGHVCAICGEVGTDVDHVKDSNPPVVRGILCNNCNVAIGLLNHDPERIRAAAEYLKRPCVYVGGNPCAGVA